MGFHLPGHPLWHRKLSAVSHGGHTLYRGGLDFVRADALLRRTQSESSAMARRRCRRLVVTGIGQWHRVLRAANRVVQCGGLGHRYRTDLDGCFFLYMGAQNYR